MKVLGQNFGYYNLERRVKELWKPRGDLEIIILGFGYYLLKFDYNEDRDDIILP